MQTNIRTHQPIPMGLALRLFLSLTMQQALDGLDSPFKSDEINGEIDEMLIELIRTVCSEIFTEPIEA